MKKKLYIETYGCQMNVHDTEKAVSVLSNAGYESTDHPLDADLILLNTCMVREKAARKVYTRVSQLKSELRTGLGASRALPLFGVMGCVAQAEAGRIFDRCREVRLVLGPQSIARLPELVAQVEEGFPRAMDVRLSREADFLELEADRRNGKFVAYITITEGCNKFCSYCVVPFTRGRERSRPAERILAEAQSLAKFGYKEVQLLGQNVNSYGLSGSGAGLLPLQRMRQGGEITFAALLSLLARESGIPRLKYTTSFPRDFTQEIVEAMDAHDNLCEWIHLPPQSGSDRVLRAMQRGYTRSDYLEKISLIKRAAKDISITGDIIIGFPGESEDDFRETLRLVAEVEFDGLYIFKYSPRPHTPAAAYSDSVSDEIKAERFERLQQLQDSIQQKRYSRYLGREVEVLVERTSARSTLDFTGHTRCNKIVNFRKGGCALGDIAKVKVQECRPHSLYGEFVSKVI